jgi:hypothetical protein
VAKRATDGTGARRRSRYLEQLARIEKDLDVIGSMLAEEPGVRN